MAEAGIKELLQAGVHFGHQTQKWNPGMRRYIHGQRDGIHVIDLLQTEKLLKEATDVCSEIAGRGGKVLFVGTKKQARDSIEEWADKCGMPFVSRRWLGGLLTNFQTINKRIGRLHELNALENEGKLELLPTKERMTMEAELAKLEFNLGGVRDMQRPPEAIFVIDLLAEEIAVKEGQRLGIPIVGLVDTNCDPGPVTHVIPGNDDAIRSCDLVVSTLGEAILSSATAWQQAEEARYKREAEEKAKREAEAAAKREQQRAAEEEQKAAAEAERQKQALAGGQAPEGAPQRAGAPHKPAAGSKSAPAKKPAAPKKAAPAKAAAGRSTAPAPTKAAPAESEATPKPAAEKASTESAGKDS